MAHVRIFDFMVRCPYPVPIVWPHGNAGFFIFEVNGWLVDGNSKTPLLVGGFKLKNPHASFDFSNVKCQTSRSSWVYYFEVSSKDLGNNIMVSNTGSRWNIVLMNCLVGWNSWKIGFEMFWNCRPPFKWRLCDYTILWNTLDFEPSPYS